MLRSCFLTYTTSEPEGRRIQRAWEGERTQQRAHLTGCLAFLAPQLRPRCRIDEINLLNSDLAVLQGAGGCSQFFHFLADWFWGLFRGTRRSFCWWWLGNCCAAPFCCRYRRSFGCCGSHWRSSGGGGLRRLWRCGWCGAVDIVRPVTLLVGRVEEKTWQNYDCVICHIYFIEFSSICNLDTSRNVEINNVLPPGGQSMVWSSFPAHWRNDPQEVGWGERPARTQQNEHIKESWSFTSSTFIMLKHTKCIRFEI